MFEIEFLAYLVALNLISFVLFALDKTFAQRGRRRIKERTLLLVAAFGGIVGILAGRRILRHKTRKQPFGFRVYLIAGIQILLLSALLFPGGQEFFQEMWSRFRGS